MELYRFTNVHGRQNHGVILDRVSDGANVLMDAFVISDRVTLPARYCFVSFAPNPYLSVETQSDVLPLSTPVVWSEPEIGRIVALMQKGEFPDWWATNQGRIIREYIRGTQR